MAQNISAELFLSLKHMFSKRVLFFAGEMLQGKIATTKTMNKKGPSAEVEKIMMNKLRLEYDFYNFVKDRFHSLTSDLKSSSS